MQVLSFNSFVGIYTKPYQQVSKLAEHYEEVLFIKKRDDMVLLPRSGQFFFQRHLECTISVVHAHDLIDIYHVLEAVSHILVKGADFVRDSRVTTAV